MSMSRLEAVLAQIDQSADASLSKLADAERFSTETAALRVEGESEDRAVRVVVDGVGQMISVDFVGTWERLSATELGASVLAAHAQAKRKLSFEVERLGKTIMGEDSPSARAFSQSYRQQFGYEEVEK